MHILFIIEEKRGDIIKASSIRRVYASIKKHGDDFWNDTLVDAGKSWNGFLFDEVLEMLEKDGLDLELVEREKIQS